MGARGDSVDIQFDDFTARTGSHAAVGEAEVRAIQRHQRSKVVHVTSHAGRHRVARLGDNSAPDVDAFLREPEDAHCL